MTTPKYLQAGDTVGLIATARKINENEIAPFYSLLESWKLKYIKGKHLFGSHNQFSGTEVERAADLQEMIENPAVRAIICVRGGYGTIRIIRHVDFTHFEKDPKWIAGFSDVTALHAYLNNYLGTESLHSIMPVNYKPGENDNAAETLRKALFGEPYELTTPPNKYNRFGKFQGEITGGNLSLLYSINGSNLFPDMKNKILFIEDIDEYLYHIDRMMQNLTHSGVFHKIGGLMVGAFTNLRDNEIPYGSDFYEIISETVEKFDFPLVFDFPAGHISQNNTLIFGREMQLRVDKNGGKLKPVSST
jgi:muramoyltetrapeptide carboxypeptidase